MHPTVRFGPVKVREITAVETSFHSVCPETVDDGESSSSTSSSAASAAAGVGTGDGTPEHLSASASANPRDLVPGVDVYKFCRITHRSDHRPKMSCSWKGPGVAVIVTLRFNYGTGLHEGHSKSITRDVIPGCKYRTHQPLLVTGFQLIGDKDVIKRVEREFRKYIVHSSWDTSFVYKLDEYVAPNGSSSEPKKEVTAGCGKGIHFFFDKKSAINYSGITKGAMAEIRT